MNSVAIRLCAVLVAGLFLSPLAGCGSKDAPIEVAVAVDFGPAGRPPLEKTVAVRETGTVFDALRSAFSVATSGR
jgi:hypothetical protein